MMIVSVISLILSLLIQGIISNYIGYTPSGLSIFYTVYILVDLIVILPYFYSSKKYIILLVVFGLIIDIAYTNTFILNVVIFLVCYFISKIIISILPHNILTINICSFISIMLYHILSFIILFIVSYDNYTLSNLFNILTHSILMTIIYTTVMYKIIGFIYEKFNLREVR